jgi:hypothetical protein
MGWFFLMTPDVHKVNPKGKIAEMKFDFVSNIPVSN